MSRTNKGPHRKSRALDRSCRSHGSCPWCRVGRQYKTRRRCPSIAEQVQAEGLTSLRASSIARDTESWSAP